MITPLFKWHVILRYLSYPLLSIPVRRPMERESPLNGACKTSSSTKGNLKENPLQSSLKITKHTKPLKENFTSKHNHPVLDNRSDEEEGYEWLGKTIKLKDIQSIQLGHSSYSTVSRSPETITEIPSTDTRVSDTSKYIDVCQHLSYLTKWRTFNSKSISNDSSLAPLNDIPEGNNCDKRNLMSSNTKLDPHVQRSPSLVMEENEPTANNTVDSSVQNNLVETGSTLDRTILSEESEAFFWDWILR